MQKIKFLKEPGYMFDLFYLFTAYFNKAHCEEDILNKGGSENDKEWLGEVLKSFRSFPDELLPFFYLRDNEKTFMGRYYFSEYFDRFTKDYGLTFVQTELMNQERVIEQLIRFYFPDISEETAEECKSSLKTINRLIKESSYPDALKSTLYSFFIDPAPVLQRLSYQLLSKGFTLEQYYSKEFETINRLQNELDWETIVGFYKSCDVSNTTINLEQHDVTISFCLYNRFAISIRYDEKCAVLMLGVSYQNCIDSLMNGDANLQLKEFGTVLSEENRLEILEYLVKKGEATIKEIEQKFGFTSANAYYHISMMTRAGVLKTRNQGRLLFYSINHTRFATLCAWFGRYSITEGEEKA